MSDPTQSETEVLKRRKRGAPWLLGSLVLLLLFALIAQQTFYVWSAVTPDTASDTLFLYALSSLNFVAFIVFSFIFVRNLLKLRSERRERQLGAKIKTRLVMYFIAVSLLPITAMALYSYFFLNRSLDKWFSGLPEDVVSEAGRAAEKDAEFQLNDLQRRGELLGAALGQAPSAESAPGAVQQLIDRGGFAGIALVSPADGAPRVYVRSDMPSDAARELEAQLASRSPLSRRYNVASLALGGGTTLTVAAERRANEHLGQIIAGAENFAALRTVQRKIRVLGLSVLALLTLLLLFAATWAAIHLARGIGLQIKALALASEEVARGNLAHRVTTVTDDELVLLAASFNQMTEQLAENRRRIDLSAAQLRETNLALEERRAYIETVLETLSTGVISLDGRDRVTTINVVAAAMLGLGATQPSAGTRLADLTSAEDYAVLSRLIRRARRTGSAADQAELVGRAGGNGGENGEHAATDGVAPGEGTGQRAPLPIAITATTLGPTAGGGGAAGERGVVCVLEDLSELLAAQRAAAWSEVARRMAHEIKNPLTPIQLSAERIARNFGRAVAAPHVERELPRVAQVVEDCTATITREVASLKGMVDEFSRFARLPQVRLEAADLNEIIAQAVALYEDRLGDARLEVRLAPSLPRGLLDGEQLRRVFINLIDNSLEALAETGGERRVTVASAYDPARALLRAEVADTGHGISAKDLPRLFQPYFSTRGRGTGLGLAIVQRIVADHGGRIRAGLNHPRGAKFMIELPIAEAARDAEADESPTVQPISVAEQISHA